MSEYKFDNGFIYRNGFRISAPNAARIMSDAHEQSKKDQSEIETLRTQLAKANERVKELEQERDHSQRMYNSLLGDLSAGYGELSISECEKHLNKFAIENKAEAFNAVKNEIKTVGGLELCDVVEFIDEQIEQLRKEQEL